MSVTKLFNTARKKLATPQVEEDSDFRVDNTEDDISLQSSLGSSIGLKSAAGSSYKSEPEDN